MGAIEEVVGLLKVIEKMFIPKQHSSKVLGPGSNALLIGTMVERRPDR